MLENQANSITGVEWEWEKQVEGGECAVWPEIQAGSQITSKAKVNLWILFQLLMRNH